MNWKPGDKAIVCMPAGNTCRIDGQQVSIVAVNVHGRTGGGIEFRGAEVDAPKKGGVEFPYYVFQYKHIRPIYDGNETVSWEDCVWRPEPVFISAGQTLGETQ